MLAPIPNRETYAGLLLRSIAYVIDCIIAFGIFAATQLLVFKLMREALGVSEEWFRSGINTELYTLMTISLPVWLYFALCEQSAAQATVGKRFMKLRVADAMSRRRISFPRSLLRTIVKLLPWEIAHLSNNLPEPLWYMPEPEFRIGFVAAGLLMGVYVATVALTEKKQGLHDLIARTVILKSGVKGA